MSTTLFIIDGRFPGNTMRDPDETSHDEQLIHLKNIHSLHFYKDQDLTWTLVTNAQKLILKHGYVL